MNNKPFYLLPVFAASLLVQLGANAAPLVSIGDNADVFFNGSSSLRWSSNIFRDEDEEVSDLTWTLSPGFEINIGRGLSNADLSIITRYDIIRYQDNDHMDVELFHIKAVGSYRSSRLDLSGSLSFDENKSSSGENNIAGDLIEYDTYGARLNGEYRFSPKFSFGAGVNYSEKEYTTFTDRFADRETVSVPLDVFYELTPKVDLSVGYTYTTTDVEETSFSTGPFTAFETSGYETESHFFNVGARGNLLPKLSGYFKIGYRTRSSEDSSRRNYFVPTGATIAPLVGPTNRADSGMLGLDADFKWSATPKLSTNLGLSRNFGVGGEGQSTENSSVNVSASYAINSYFSASGNLGYTLRDYTDTDRKDNQYRAGVRLNYTPNQYWRFGAGYTYSENDSDRVDGSYVNHIIDLSATLRY